MAYSATVKERAYTLFLMGNNPEQVADILRESHPKMSANTIRAWAESENESGETWFDLRGRVDSAARKRIESQAASERARGKSRASMIAAGLYDQIVKALADMEIKSIEQAVYAFRTMQEAAIKLEDAEMERWHPVNASTVVLEVLEEIPDVKKALRANWGQFTKRLSERLDRATDSKEIEVAAIEPPSRRR